MSNPQTTPKLRISVVIEEPEHMHENAMTFYRRLTDDEAVEAFKEIWREVTDASR